MPSRLFLGTQYGLRVWEGETESWEERDQAFGNKVVDTIAGALQEPQWVFIGIAHEGAYRTLDGGLHWKKVLDGDVRAVAVDPTDAATVYAGTEPVHLYRSTDCGDHWQEIEAVLEFPEEVKKKWSFPRPPHQGHVRHIFIAPQDRGMIYLALEHGGIIRTLDGGKHWQDVSGGIDYLDIHFIANHPDDASLFFASTARGFYRSHDPALGWERAENGLSKKFCYNLVFFLGKPTVMLLATGDGSPAFWERPGLARSTVYRSIDAAGTWQAVYGGMPESLEAMPWAMAADPENSQAAFAGFGLVSRGRAEVDSSQGWEETAGQLGAVWATFNRGENWKQLSVTTPAVRSMWASRAYR
jgi:photosystem II stability/assembly factor-like uncharacterized protein